MKIGVVGCGNVGSASAYACVLRGVGLNSIGFIARKVCNYGVKSQSAG